MIGLAGRFHQALVQRESSFLRKGALTGGGPGRSTQVLSLYAFLKAYKEFNFGYASALATAMFLMLMLFSWAYVRLSNVMRD